MKRLLIALTIAASFMASGASAFNPEDLQKLLDTNECRFCILRGLFIREANLEGASIGGTNLRGAQPELCGNLGDGVI